MEVRGRRFDDYCEKENSTPVGHLVKVERNTGYGGQAGRNRSRPKLFSGVARGKAISNVLDEEEVAKEGNGVSRKRGVIEDNYYARRMRNYCSNEQRQNNLQNSRVLM